MKTTVSIPGMHCNSCATTVKEVSSDFPAIQTVEVNLETKVVSVEHDENFDLAAWTEEIEALGEEYRVESHS
ncbi:MAG: heavy metal-associated domain-containing protein [Candidatus Gracilibacteria bacterium]|jgi:copper chaperone CopZ